MQRAGGRLGVWPATAGLRAVLSHPESAGPLFAVSANCAFTNVYGNFTWGDSSHLFNSQIKQCFPFLPVPHAIFIASLGLKVAKIHRVLSLSQNAWMETYINFNTGNRKKSKNDFEKDLCKLMNNTIVH